MRDAKASANRGLPYARLRLESEHYHRLLSKLVSGHDSSQYLSEQLGSVGYSLASRRPL